MGGPGLIIETRRYRKNSKSDGNKTFHSPAPFRRAPENFLRSSVFQKNSMAEQLMSAAIGWIVTDDPANAQTTVFRFPALVVCWPLASISCSRRTKVRCTLSQRPQERRSTEPRRHRATRVALDFSLLWYQEKSQSVTYFSLPLCRFFLGRSTKYLGNYLFI